MKNILSDIIKFILVAVFATGGFTSLNAQKKDKGIDSGIHTSLYYSDKAEDLENANSWEAAKRIIDEGLKHYPDDPELLYLNGKYYYFAQRDLQKARYNLVKALQENDQQLGAKRVLVDVEQDSRHYSSAICYINELLEQQPYDRDLWRRKIDLYRKTGNKVEAEAALERLARIYPNDTIIRRELQVLSRENWNKRLSSTTLAERAATLEGLVNSEPDNLDYYMELSDVYIKMGDYQKSLNTAKRGLNRFPKNAWLVRRVANLMSEEGLYSRALMFLKENQQTGVIYDNMLRDAANDARMKDPYEMYGRLYLATGDRDALNYLLNTSLTRGYYDDALEYLSQAYKLEGRTVSLLIKEYELQKRMGNQGKAEVLLNELFSKNPKDDDLRGEYVAMQMALATIDEEQQDWPRAYERLTNASKSMEIGSDQWIATIARRINILGIMGRDDEARRLYAEASVDDPVNRGRFAAAYQDIVAKQIKQYIEDEKYESAYRLGQNLLGTIYDSEVGLRTCINMAQTLKLNDQFYKYAELGYEYYPDQPYFIIKQGVALQQQGRYAKALKILNPQKPGELYPTQQLINPYAGITEDFATLLIRNKMPDLAIEKIDEALKFDPDNTELGFLKGLAYEQLKEYGKAYNFQTRNYIPNNAEQEEWIQHWRYLNFRSLKNHFDLSYTSGFFDNRSENLSTIAHMYSLAELSYSHLWKNTTLTIGANYKGTDGYSGFGYYETGGSGIEGWAELSQMLPHGWNMTLSGAYGTKFFNKASANLSFTAYLQKGWSLGLKGSYRLTPPVFLYDKDKAWDGDYKRRNLLMVGPRISKEWERVGLHLYADLISLDFVKDFYYNISLKSKFFVNNDGVSSVGASVGMGSFPELAFFDQSTMNGISNRNAMVGVDGNYLITKNLYVSLAGAWNTYYSPVFTEEGKPVDSYRNIYSISLSLHIAF